MSKHINWVRIKAVYHALEELGNKVVFVGGATVSLYTDREAEEVRPTDDVDILIELLNYRDYTGLEEKLRNKGFINDQESNVICRYKIHGIIVDVMPTSEKILGFTNRWYDDGFKNSVEYAFDEKCIIKIFKPEYFLASKMEAFNNRGKGDGRSSTDFEDIIYFLNNRTSIWQELESVELNVKKYISNNFKTLLENKYIDEWISSHLEYADQDRLSFIINEMKKFAVGNK